MDVLIGIDGGGSKTRCVVSDRRGRVLGRGDSGPSNYLKEGLYPAKRSLREAVRLALKSAQQKQRSIVAACAGLAGVYRRQDQDVMGRVLREILATECLVLESDAFVALAGATEGRPGLIVISGTGSIAFGVDGNGKRARAGGWGHILGDEGSGYDIARRGLMAALRDYDGRGPKTLIRTRIAEELYLKSTDQIIPLLYGEQLGQAYLAALYPLVLSAAEAGDRVADQLLRSAAQELALATASVIRKLAGGATLPIAVHGGVFQNSPRLLHYFQEALKQESPAGEVIEPKETPEIGAILAARAALEGRRLFAG